MTLVGINTEEQEQIFLLISAILHLGNIQFVDGDQTDSSKLANREQLETAASLLGCDAATLEKYLITKKVVAAMDSYFTPLTTEQVKNSIGIQSNSYRLVRLEMRSLCYCIVVCLIG